MHDVELVPWYTKPKFVRGLPHIALWSCTPQDLRVLCIKETNACFGSYSWCIRILNRIKNHLLILCCESTCKHLWTHSPRFCTLLYFNGKISIDQNTNMTCMTTTSSFISFPVYTSERPVCSYQVKVATCTVIMLSVLQFLNSRLQSRIRVYITARIVNDVI